MNVLIIHNRYVYPGGEDEVVRAEQDILRRFGHDVVVYERHNDEISAMDAGRKARFLLKDVYWSQKTYHELRGLIRRHRPDVAHIHNTFYMVSPSVYQACSDSRLPVVQTLHNYRFLCPVATFYRRGNICHECLTQGRKAAVHHRCWDNSVIKTFFLTRLLDVYAEKDVVHQKVDAFIALSEFSKTMFVQAGYDAGRIFVKPNFLTDDPGASSAKGGYAVFVGALQEYKGVKTLVEAFKRLPCPFPLKIMGDGPLRAWLVSAIEGTAIEYLGQRPHREMLGVLKDAAFLVAPSTCYETFSRVVMEAYACGGAVIVSHLGAMKEIVEEHQTGLFFRPGDAEDLAVKVQYLVQHPDVAGRMGQRAREAYEEKFTAQSNYQKLMSIYQQTISAHGI